MQNVNKTVLKHDEAYYQTNKFLWRQRIGYGISDYACNLAYLLANTYLMFYYTNCVGLGAGGVGIMFVVSKIIDAVTDYTVGVLADHTNTKMGRFRPWLLAGAPVLAIGMVLLFSVPTGWDKTAQMVWAFVTYAIFCLGYTIVNIPMLPMLTTLSKSPAERTMLATTRTFFANFGSLTSSLFVLPMIYFFAGSKTAMGAELAKGYRDTNIVLGIAVLVLLCISVFNTEEINPPIILEGKEEKRNIFQDMKAVFTNKYFIMIQINVFSTYLGLLAMYAAIQYYYTYIIKNVSVMSLALTLLTIVAIPMMMLGAFLNNKKNVDKVKIMQFGNILNFLGYLILFFNKSALGATLAICVVGLSWGFRGNMQFAMFSDVCDYGEYKNGRSMAGTQTAVYCFIGKFASAAANAVVGALLVWGAYDAKVLDAALAAGENLTAMYPRMITSINLSFAGVGMVTAAICFLSVLGYDLDKKYPAIRKELDERRAKIEKTE